MLIFGVPHISIEYSANVADHHDIDALVVAVHEAALIDGLPPLAGLRTRASVRQSYRIADGQATHGFIAIMIRIGPGREALEKKRFLTAVLDAAEAHINSEIANSEIANSEVTKSGSTDYRSASYRSAEVLSPLALAWSAELQEIDPEFRINRNYVADHIDTNKQG